jgi:hypothetical protein
MNVLPSARHDAALDVIFKVSIPEGCDFKVGPPWRAISLPNPSVT